MSSSKRALITGVTGQDGAYLSELLLEKGYVVHGVKRRSSSFNTGRIEHLYQDPHDPDQVAAVGHVAVVQDEVPGLDMRILVQVIDARGVEARRAALDAVDFVALLEQQLGQVGAVLAGHARDQRGLLLGEGWAHGWRGSSVWEAERANAA